MTVHIWLSAYSSIEAIFYDSPMTLKKAGVIFYRIFYCFYDIQIMIRYCILVFLLFDGNCIYKVK